MLPKAGESGVGGIIMAIPAEPLAGDSSETRSLPQRAPLRRLRRGERPAASDQRPVFSPIPPPTEASGPDVSGKLLARRTGAKTEIALAHSSFPAPRILLPKSQA